MAHLPYLDFQVRLLPHGSSGGRAMVVRSAAGGGGSTTLELPWTPIELERLLYALSFDPHDPDPEDTPRIPTAASVGRLLSEQLFRGRLREAFVKSRAVAAAGGHLGLRLQLLFDLEDELAPDDDPRTFRARSLALAALPWELLLDPESSRPLARNRDTPISRVLAVSAATPRPPLALPLRVLVVGASPVDLDALDVDGELERLRAALGERPGIEVEGLAHTSLELLREKLSRADAHVLHFMGHGEFDRRGAGALVFEGDHRQAERIAGSALAEVLRGRPSLRLVTLNACRGAQFPRRDGLDPSAGVAIALLEAGLPAVVAMQQPITDPAARAFAAGFYGRLAGGACPDEAVAEGRQAILAADPASREWATPVLYQPQGAEPVLPSLAGLVEVPAEIRAEIRADTTYLDAKTAGFVGREHLRETLETFLAAERCGYFLLAGDPGIGKSAFMADWVRRRRCLYHFNRRAEGVVRPEAFLRNVCAQLILERHLGHRSLPPRVDRDAGYLVELLDEASRRLAAGERLIVAVDALDESDLDSLPAGSNPLYLPQHLPAGVFFVVSSRHTDAVVQADVPCRPERLDHDSPENRADVRELVGNHLGLPGIVAYRRQHDLDEDGFVDLLAERSDGNFMYLHHVLPAIERGELGDLALDDVPRGLDGYYEQHWQRLRLRDEAAWLEVGLPVLYVITAAGTPVSAELIDRQLGRPGLQRVKAVLRGWRPFLHVSRATAEDGARVPQYSLYHTSFSLFLQRKDEVQDQGLSLGEIRERLFLQLLDDDDPAS